ncbi:MAG TPA: inositol monophosphatase family protein [Candidatus Saccharimonadales bacterium]
MAKDFTWKQNAEKVIRDVLTDVRPTLVAAWGNAEFTLKKDRSIVTELDVTVENRLREALTKFDKSVGFGGEESGVDYEQKTFWIADPIDGTEQLTRGIRGCVNQLALIEDGTPTMSIIYDFIGDEWYAAFAGHGAFCNGRQIHTSERPLDRSWLNFDLPLAAATAEDKVAAERLQALPVKLIKTIEAARFVASGKIEGYIAVKGRGGPWDYVPRAMLMQEAGARVTHLHGGPYDFRDPNFIAAPPHLYDDIFTAINTLK